MFGKKKEDKSATQDQVLGEPTHPPMGTDSPMPGDDKEYLPGFKTPDEVAKALKEATDKAAKTEAELAAMRASQEQLQGMLDQLTARPGTTSDKSNDTVIDWSKLPDPVEDKDGFLKGVVQIVQATAQHTAQTQAGQTARQQQIDKMWTEFTDEHEDLAEFPEVTEAAVRNVLADVRARGLDPDKFMFSNKKRFYKLVADEGRKRLTVMKEKLGASDKDDAAGDGVDSGRDIGLSDTSRGSSKKPKDDGKIGSLVAELKQVQRTSGFF